MEDERTDMILDRESSTDDLEERSAAKVGGESEVVDCST